VRLRIARPCNALRIAARSVIAQLAGGTGNFSLCHGLAGDAELFLLWHQITGDQEARELVDDRGGRKQNLRRSRTSLALGGGGCRRSA